jgi:biopolymer transport protein ExbB
MEFLKLGGPLLWIIVACSIVAMIVFIERAFHLHRARIKSDDFLKGILNILRKGNAAEALTICEETPGPVAQIVRVGIVHRAAPREVAEAAMANAGSLEIARLEERIGVVATVAQIAPLLGLLGTVVAFMQFVWSLHSPDTLVLSADVLGRMWAALITTGAGLTVAIPCHVAHNMLVTRVERLVGDMERALNETLAFVLTEGRGGPAERPAP